MNDEKRDEVIANDLACIAEYAEAIRRQIYNGDAPRLEYLRDMAELAEKVQRQLDPKFEEWVNEQARRGKSP